MKIKSREDLLNVLHLIKYDERIEATRRHFEFISRTIAIEDDISDIIRGSNHHITK